MLNAHLGVAIEKVILAINLLVNSDLSGSKLTNNLLDAIPCNANYGSKEMDDRCYDLRPVIITLDKKVIQDVSKYFSSKTKYCNIYNTYYKLYKLWIKNNDIITTGIDAGNFYWKNGWGIYCKKENYTKIFYKDNSGSSTVCPDYGWSYVKTISIGKDYGNNVLIKPYLTSKKITCEEVGTNVWYK